MKKAFTLIELLIVIAVIGILAGIVVFSVSGAQKKSRDNTRKTDIELIASALEMYKQAKGSYPDDMCTVTVDGCRSRLIKIQGNNTSANGDVTFRDAISSYLSPIPTDPTNATKDSVEYYYYYNRTLSGGYELIANMETRSGGNSPNTKCYGYIASSDGLWLSECKP